MPEFKLNGKTYSGSTNYASAITYTEDDGSKTTIQDKISELNSNMGVDNMGTTVHEKLDELLTKTTPTITKLASNVYEATIDCTSYDGYENFTMNNFLLDVTSINTYMYGAGDRTLNITKSYNATTGVFTVTGRVVVSTNYTLTARFDIYLVR